MPQMAPDWIKKTPDWALGLKDGSIQELVPKARPKPAPAPAAKAPVKQPDPGKGLGPDKGDGKTDGGKIPNGNPAQQ